MTKKWIVLTVAALLVTVAAAYVFSKPELLTAQQTEQLIEERYNGDVTEIIDQHHQFLVMMDIPEQGTYKVIIDKSSGSIEKMIRTQEAPVIQQEESAPAPPPIQEAAPLLSPEEAGRIATTAVAGVVDEVELGDEEEAGLYIVDMDAENGEEATVLLDAVTGEVVSVSWDD